LLFVGDSCTFGFGLLHHEGFVYRLERKLRAEFPRARLECINAGVPGYSLFQGFRFLETKGFRYQPDLIVLNFGWNDAGNCWAGAGDVDRYGPRLICRYAPGLRASRLYQLAWSAVENWSTNHSAGRPRVRPVEFRSLLAQTDEEARRHGADLLLLVWAAPFNLATGAGAQEVLTPYQREMLAYGRQLRLGPGQADGLVDLVPVVQELAKKQSPSAIFLDHVHATSLANERFAEALAKKLIPWVRWRLSNSGK
jgi:lysophospholipase L1-like esterase